MISYEEALARLLGHIDANPSEDTALASLVTPGARHRPRWLSRSLQNPGPLPPFDNSAMDGYAVRAADTQPIEGRAAILKIVGSIAAGDSQLPTVGPGEAARIFTGAPLPPGADAVVMQEDCESEPDGTLAVLDPVKPWENIRFAGEDLKPGDTLTRSGDELTPQNLALLMAAGVTEVPLHRTPTLALIGSGSELRMAGQPLSPGSIHESNLGPLSWLAESAGAHVVQSTLVPDHPETIRETIESAASCAQVILTVGGASVGEHDHLRKVALDAGFQIDFWRLALKPGKPFFAGRRDNTLLLGVPGNPVSAFVTTLLLVLPVLRRLAGCPSPAPRTRPGYLTEPLTNPDSRRHFVRVRMDSDGSIRSTGPQASHILSSMAGANALVDVPPRSTLEKETVVQAIVMP
jgi:molybdopterin molybdotransferase